jgi:hypothetical protein
VSTWFYSFKSFKGARDFSRAPGVWTMIPGKRSSPPRKSRRLNVTIGASPADVLIGIVAKCHSPQGKYSHKSLKEPDAAVAVAARLPPNSQKWPLRSVHPAPPARAPGVLPVAAWPCVP